MTDIVITEEVVGSTITALEATLRRALERYDTEAREAAEKRVAMTEVAHRRGTANGIGPALDDLLEEFDLPRRPWRGSLYMEVRLTAPVERGGDGIRITSGYTVYREPGATLSWTNLAERETTLRDGDTCLCSNAEEEARAWARDHYGSGHMADMALQVGPTRCSHDDCPHSDDRRPSHASAARHDWSGVPSFPAVVPEPTPSGPLAA